MKNPPAFPTYEYQEKYGQIMAVGGMTLRDYFAAKAMQGLLSDGVGENADINIIASDAYLTADAMMKAREA
jgi:hypothetical protein